MDKIRIAIIGTGMAFERLHYPVFRQLSDKFEIVAICDQDREKLEKWRTNLGLKPEDAYTDFKDMLVRSDVDAFDILVPIELNFKIAEAVARSNKPFILEKPLAPTQEQANAARKLTKKFNVPVMVAENYRYNEENNIIRDLVRTKEIGDVFYFIKNKVMDFPQDMLKDDFAAAEWRQHPEFPGGTVFDTGVHDIAGLRHIFGAVDFVHAVALPQKADFAPYSAIQVNLSFKTGVIGQFSFFSAGEEMQRPLIGLRIFGSTGMIYLEEATCGTINVAYNDGNSKQIPYEPDKGFYNEMLNFYKAAIGEEPLSVTPEMEFGDADTMFAILKSARTNRIVKVDKTREYEFV
ncbi:MAG: Gfo/Idh/MocA family oxidoreductase [Firmicutes bacterium]|nr:Gfo/Idh/MocA family oxidoreductase [Bacillota bacterium]